MAVTLLQHSLTSELQKGEKYQEEVVERCGSSSQQGIGWPSAGMAGSEAAVGKAKASCLLYCQEGPTGSFCLETIPSIYLEGRSSGLGHPTKLTGAQYVPLQSGVQGSDFKITDLGLTPWCYELPS